MHEPGNTRSVSRREYLLQTPDSFVRTGMPGLSGGTAIVHIAPAGGAGFTQWTLELEDRGTLETPSTDAQRFLYVLAGTAELTAHGAVHRLDAGGYAYLPGGAESLLRAAGATKAVVIEKTYVPLAGLPAPRVLIGQEDAVAATPLLGDEDLQVRALLLEHAGFDFAVNTMTYQPGAALAMVEVHVMEHGLLMLEGGGIYRLAEDWHPVKAGDFIWMAPFCPQWFGALGKTPARYLIYKNFNRHPLA